MAAITVNTNGQTLRVNASVSHWTTAALAVTASAANDVESTTTTTITGDYTMHFSNTATTVLVTVKQLDGTTLLAQTFNVEAGTGQRTLNPLPDEYQQAADHASARGLALAPAGAVAQTMDRAHAKTSSGILVSGRMWMTAIDLPASTVVTSISYLSGTQAAVAPTAQWFALFSSARVLLRQTTDDTTTAWAANTVKTLTLTTPFTTTYAGLHYLGICAVGGTMPSFLQGDMLGTAAGVVPILNGYADTGLTTTAPATAAAITAAQGQPWAYVS